MDIRFLAEPDRALNDAVRALATEYSRDLFTGNFPAEIAADQRIQRTACLTENGRLLSVIVYTCFDGVPQITFMATRRDRRGQGCGTMLMTAFLERLKQLGFHQCTVYTHIPERKPANIPTVAFYEHVGFWREQEDVTLWEDGALKMVWTG